PNLRHPIRPFPIVPALSQDRPDNLQHSVHRGIGNAFAQSYVRQAVDQTAVDLIEDFAAEETIGPTQVHLVGLDRRLVRSLLHPTDNRLIPGASWTFSKSVHPPQLHLAVVVVFLS